MEAKLGAQAAAGKAAREARVSDFPALLGRFAEAVAANDGAAFSALFTEDGVYDDGFFGEYKGRKAIAGMLQHFHDTGSNYRWDFFDALSDGRAGYARYRFSYASGMPGAQGKPVVFEGTSHFVFQGNLIARYEENFDRGMALAQQDFAPERIKKVLLKLAARQNASTAAKEHLARFA
jgi:SnoaL-like domain